jgi:hypothetical protein
LLFFSYKKLGDIVDHLFPPRHAQKEESATVSIDYNSFLYWRVPVPSLETDLINEFIQQRDAAAANSTTDKNGDAKKSAAKRPASASVASAKNSKSPNKSTNKTANK